jgi:hypothetical protein
VPGRTSPIWMPSSRKPLRGSARPRGRSHTFTKLFHRVMRRVGTDRWTNRILCLPQIRIAWPNSSNLTKLWQLAFTVHYACAAYRGSSILPFANSLAELLLICRSRPYLQIILRLTVDQHCAAVRNKCGRGRSRVALLHCLNCYYRCERSNILAGNKYFSFWCRYRELSGRGLIIR